LAVFIDEVQDPDVELMSVLESVQHTVNQRELTFFLVGAGLPNLPAFVCAARTYLRSAHLHLHHIGPCPPTPPRRWLSPRNRWAPTTHPKLWRPHVCLRLAEVRAAVAQ